MSNLNLQRAGDSGLELDPDLDLEVALPRLDLPEPDELLPNSAQQLDETRQAVGGALHHDGVRRDHVHVEVKGRYDGRSPRR